MTRWLPAIPVTGSLLILIVLSQLAIAKKKGGGGTSTPTPPTTQSTTLTLAELNQRMVALEAIDGYQLTEAQMEAFRASAEELKLSHPKIADPPASKELAAYRGKLIELCAELEKGSDDAKIDELREGLDAQAEQAKYVYPTPPEPEAAARTAAAAFAGRLSSHQIASSLALYSEHIIDPAELLLRTAEAKKEAKAQNQWPTLRDGASKEVAYLVARYDPAASKVVADCVSAWLEANPDIDAPIPDAQRTAWEDAARKTVGPVDPYVVLRRWLERDLARLLSNPQVLPALGARLGDDN